MLATGDMAENLSGAMLAVSLAIMLRITARVVLIEVPRITPVLAANIPAPAPYRWTPAIALALLLTAVVAYRWSKLPAVGLVADGVSWRRDESRYYHERFVLLLLLAGVGLAECINVLWGMFAFFRWWPFWEVLPYLVTEPMGALSLALILLAAQGVFSGRSKRRDAVSTQPAGLRPGLFLLVWTGLLMIVLCGARCLRPGDSPYGSDRAVGRLHFSLTSRDCWFTAQESCKVAAGRGTEEIAAKNIEESRRFPRQAPPSPFGGHDFAVLLVYGWRGWRSWRTIRK